MTFLLPHPFSLPPSTQPCQQTEVPQANGSTLLSVPSLNSHRMLLKDFTMLLVICCHGHVNMSAFYWNQCLWQEGRRKLEGQSESSGLARPGTAWLSPGELWRWPLCPHSSQSLDMAHPWVGLSTAEQALDSWWLSAHSTPKTLPQQPFLSRESGQSIPEFI